MRLSNILGWVFLIGSILHFLFSWGDEVVPWALIIIAKLFFIEDQIGLK